MRAIADSDYALQTANLAEVARATTVASVKDELRQQRLSIFEGQQPAFQRIAQELADNRLQLEAALQPASRVAQQLDIASVCSEVGARHLVSDWSSIADSVRWMTDPSIHENWQAVLTRWPKLPEAVFTAGLPEIERSVYSAMRPELIDFAQSLRDAYDFPSLKVSVSWLDAPNLSDLFELDLDRAYDLGFDAPLADGPVITAPSKTAPTKPRKLPDFVSPFDTIDTTTQQRPLAVKRVLLTVGGCLWDVRVISGAFGGALGNAIGGVLGGGIGGAVGPIITVIVERYRNR